MSDNELFIIRRASDEAHAMLRDGLFTPDWQPWNNYQDERPEFLRVKRGRDRRPIGDCMFILGYVGLIVSKRARDVIQSLRLCASISWIEVIVDGDESGSYWLADCDRAQFHDIFDLDRSEYGYYPGTDVINYSSVTRWVIDAARVPELDLFYSAHTEWFTTDTLKNSFSKASLTRFSFLPVELSGDE